VIFDETVYPFSHLNPTAGAKLRAEVIQLPPKVWVPSSFFRGESVANPYANVSSNRITELSDEQEEKLAQNPVETNSEELAGAANIMLPPVTEHKEDLPPAAAAPTVASSSGVESGSLLPSGVTEALSGDDTPPTQTASAPAHVTEGDGVSPDSLLRWILRMVIRWDPLCRRLQPVLHC
jgi:hypothetical protein